MSFGGSGPEGPQDPLQDIKDEFDTVKLAGDTDKVKGLSDAELKVLTGKYAKDKLETFKGIVESIQKLTEINKKLDTLTLDPTQQEKADKLKNLINKTLAQYKTLQNLPANGGAMTQSSSTGGPIGDILGTGTPAGMPGGITGEGGEQTNGGGKPSSFDPTKQGGTNSGNREQGGGGGNSYADTLSTAKENTSFITGSASTTGKVNVIAASSKVNKKGKLVKTAVGAEYSSAENKGDAGVKIILDKTDESRKNRSMIEDKSNITLDFVRNKYKRFFNKLTDEQKGDLEDYSITNDLDLVISEEIGITGMFYSLSDKDIDKQINKNKKNKKNKKMTELISILGEDEYRKLIDMCITRSKSMKTLIE